MILPPKPLLVSILVHLGLVLILSPGHDEEHTVQLFKGVIELGESGDGHAERPHYHPPKQRRSAEKEAAVAEAQNSEGSEVSGAENAASEPIDVQAPDGLGLAGGSGEPADERQLYLVDMIRRIQKARTYPRESLLREEEGQVLVELTIAQDGAIANLQLLKASPFDALNRSAVDSIRRAGPFAPLPSAWSRAIRVRVPVLYSLERR
jgi:protein TonB